MRFLNDAASRPRDLVQPRTYTHTDRCSYTHTHRRERASTDRRRHTQFGLTWGLSVCMSVYPSVCLWLLGGQINPDQSHQWPLPVPPVSKRAALFNARSGPLRLRVPASGSAHPTPASQVPFSRADKKRRNELRSPSNEHA